jgi:hypothetical protein
VTNRPAHPLLLSPQEFPPPSATVRVAFGAKTSRGASHQINQDHFLVIRLSRHQETVLSSLPNDVDVARFDESG